MKFVAAAVACLVGTTAIAVANAELRGVRNLEELERKSPSTRRIPPGVDISQFEDGDSDPEEDPEEPVEAPEDPDCVAMGESPYKSTEYVVIQYDSDANDNTIDFDSKSDQIILDVMFNSAYNTASGACTQKGAVNEVYDTEFLAHDEVESTFLLRIGRVTNSVGETFSSDFTNDHCGPIVYHAAEGSGSDGGTVDSAAGTVDFDSRRRLLEDYCRCPLPTATELVEAFNSALVAKYSDDKLKDFIVATEQLCADADCKVDKKGITTYDADGICLGDISALTYRPSESPTDFPTGFPTDFPTDKPSKRPTRGPTRNPTFSPSNPWGSPTGTPYPFSSPAPSATNSTSTDERFLREEVVVAGKSQDAFACLTEEQAKESLCAQVDWKLIDNDANRQMCKNYLELPYTKTDAKKCTKQSSESKVPKNFFSVSRTNKSSLVHVGVSASNPEFKRFHFSDAEALKFVEANCGADAARAYECLAPPAFRADLFRFCALYAKGGVYLDSDIVPLVPMEELYDPCAVATIGHDWPQGRPQKQMKILAGKPGAPIFGCMVQTIVGNVANRLYPDNALAITGPMALQDCYEQHSNGVSVAYHDTREAAYPYTGMRDMDRNVMLAFETPPAMGRENYKFDFETHKVYKPTCLLKTKTTIRKVAATATNI